MDEQDGRVEGFEMVYFDSEKLKNQGIIAVNKANAYEFIIR